MTTLQRFYTGASGIETIGDLEFAGIAADDEIALDGHKLEMRGGLDITTYRDTNPILQSNHDPLRLVGTVPAIDFSADGHRLLVRGRFCEPGVSAVADETRALLKSGYLRGISIGFDIVEAESLDARVSMAPKVQLAQNKSVRVSRRSRCGRQA